MPKNAGYGCARDDLPGNTGFLADMSFKREILSCLGLCPTTEIGERIQEKPNVLAKYREFGCNSFVFPLTSLKYRTVYNDILATHKGNFPAEIPSPQLDEVAILNGAHIPYTIGVVSSWIELNSNKFLINDLSFQVLQHEISYGRYLGIKKFIVHAPKGNDVLVFANNIANILEIFPTVEISILIPLRDDDNITWLNWDAIRTTCSYNARLKVALQFTNECFPIKALGRWLREPISALTIQLSIFEMNVHSQPILPHNHLINLLAIISFKLMELPNVILVDGGGRTVGKCNLKSPFISYTQNVMLQYKKISIPPLYSHTIHSLKKGDVPSRLLSSTYMLQAPLEPLVEKLDNETYKVFEQDDTKYHKYYEAMLERIDDISEEYGGLQNGVGLFMPIHVLFVGPGRGPLIDKFFQALDALDISSNYFHLTAIERNSTVINYLHEKNRDSWYGMVNIKHMDVRAYTKQFRRGEDFPVQMVISELMGSFGCNELMPECIDGIANLHVCEDSTCIFIPERIDSYVLPVYAPKLWRLASKKSPDKLYVPMLPDYLCLNENPLPVWSFSSIASNYKMEKEKSSFGFYNRHNSRQMRAKMPVFSKSVVHGFAGFFKATLAPGIEINNLPMFGNRDQPFCTSWQPAFFPLETPLFIADKSDLEICFRRVCSSDSVWYEWSAEALLCPVVGCRQDGTDKVMIKKSGSTRVHNLQGKGFKYSLL